MRLDGVPSGSQAAAHGHRCDRLGCFTATLRSRCSLIRSVAFTTHVVQTPSAAAEGHVMNWDIARLYALPIWRASAAILVIVGCRFNAMPKNTR